jgi:hypothetical protein
MAKSTALTAFELQFPFGFLLREGGLPAFNDDDGDDDEPPAFTFTTARYSREQIARLLAGGRLQGTDKPQPFVAPIAKRRGNPHPERLSVGRAQNCDVVLRVTSVSKLHAHFTLRDGRMLELLDQHSANGTFVNGARLVSGRSAPVKWGDNLRFGALDFEFAAPGKVHELLRT